MSNARPSFLLITGAKSSGKTLVSEAMADRLTAAGARVFVLDEDFTVERDRVLDAFSDYDRVILVGDRVGLVKAYHERVGGPWPDIRTIACGDVAVMGS